jgi:hypothetical protein
MATAVANQVSDVNDVMARIARSTLGVSFHVGPRY